MINYHIGFTLTSGNKKLLKCTKQPSLFNRICEIEKEFQNNSLEVNEEEGGIKLMGRVCKPTINRGKSDMIYTFVNGRPTKDNLLVGAVRYAYRDFVPNDRYPFAALRLEVPYNQVDVNVYPNKSEVRFQNKRLIYEIVTRGLIKVLSARIGSFATSDTGIIEKLKEGSPFDAGEGGNEIVDGGKSKEAENWKEFYEKRSNPLENQLMKEFFSQVKE